LANLFIMASGISGAIMTTSKYYRTLALFVVLFGALVIGTNLLFIPLYGISGAALASAVSALAYGLMRYFFLWTRYRMQPYTWKHLLAIGVAVVAWLPAILIPDLNGEDHAIIRLIADILIRSSAIAVVFIGLTLILKISPDLNSRWRRLAGWLKNRLSLHKTH